MAVTRHLEIPWDGERGVPAQLDDPAGATVGILLAHGAGAGQAHPFMAGLRSRLSSAGFAVLAFEYPYMAAGRKAPDRPPTLIACHRAAADALAGMVGTVVLAGKSMGGRIGSHIEGHDGAARIFYGYPLVGVGKEEPRDTAHLDGLTGPLLFVQGERDRLAPLDLLEPVTRRLGATLEVIADADHSFRAPKRAGLSQDEVLDTLAEITVRWLRENVVEGVA